MTQAKKANEEKLDRLIQFSFSFTAFIVGYSLGAATVLLMCAMAMAK